MIHESAKRRGRIWMSWSHLGIKASASGFPLTTELNFVGNIGEKSDPPTQTHGPGFVLRHSIAIKLCEMHVTVVPPPGRGQKSKDLADWVQI